MFYVKIKLDRDGDACIKAPIFEDNTFTTCVDCGGEVQMDLNEAIIDGALDFYGSGCRCEECSYKHALQNRGKPWAEMLIADHLASKKE